MLFWYECKKILFSPIIIILVVLCILFNIFNSYLAQTREFVFDSGEHNEYNIFENYNTSEIAEEIIIDNDIKGQNAENIRKLYEKLQLTVDEKSKNNDSVSHYFGEQTPFRHQTLFSNLFGWLIAECGILTMFFAIILTNFENSRNTESIVYSTKKGRKIIIIKLLSTFSVGLLISALIFCISIIDLFSKFDFLSVWNDNVSSSYNSGANGGAYITWLSLTVGEEFWGYIAISFGLLISFTLLGFIIGIIFRNGYIAFAIAVSFNILCAILGAISPIGSTIKAVFMSSPIGLWMTKAYWFTNGQRFIIWKNFEIVSVIANLLFFMILSFFAYKMFRKAHSGKDTFVSH
jgi:hypothetical protein